MPEKMRKRETKFTWGVKIRPTKDGIEHTRMVKKGDFAISFGKTKDGSLALVRNGKKSMEFWSANY